MGESDTPKRHCWECLRRCLVCDSTRPACNRCTRTGNPCPGYGEVKPTRLRWLTPGTVRSRRRHNRDASSSAEPSEVSVQDRQPRSPLASHSVEHHVSISRFGLYTEADALVHGAEYFNARIYPDLCPIQELGSNPAIYQISHELIRESWSRPEYLRLGTLCMTLSHRMNSGQGEPGARHRGLVERFFKYRGDAIRSLREFLNIETNCTADVAIAGIVTLLLADAQQAASLNWRPHVEAAIKVVHLRGGFSAVASSKILQPHLLLLCFVAIIGNTTCPASDLSMTQAHLAALDDIMDLSNTIITGFQLCPPSLFAEIIHINHLRAQAIAHAIQGLDPVPQELTQQAYAILERAHLFSPERWADMKPRCRQDWTLMGAIYQAAVSLYCVSSLQSLSILPPSSPSLEAERAAWAALLHQLLPQAVTSPRIMRFTLWPLVVLGVEAAGHHDGGGAVMREFVADQLPVLSRHVGTYVPLTAKGVLERFWASGKTRWDGCFDRPYAFFTQLAVDTSRILAE